MKTAVSVPNEVFDRAEALAKRLKLNRSQLFSRALAEFVSRHAPDDVTAALDRVCAQVQPGRDTFTMLAARKTFARSEW